MSEVSEFPEDQNSEGADIQRNIALVRRRYLLFLILVFLGWLVVWGASWIIPPRFKSSTLILVEEPSVPKNYVQPNIGDNLQDRLQNITQQILSRTRLLLIIDKLHLYNGGRHEVTLDEKVELMRKNIDLELVRDAHSSEITAFRIHYSASDPHVAQRVTSELTNLFIDEHLKVRQQQSESTTRFMQVQLESARANLIGQEAQIRAFEGKYGGELPSQQASNMQILSGLQAQLQNEQGALNTAKQQRVYYQALLEQYRNLRLTSQASDELSPSLPAIRHELDDLNSKMAALRTHYTDHHPDIQALQGEIARIEKLRDSLTVEAQSKDKGNRNADRDAVAKSAADPAQNAPFLQLQGQQQANLAEIANREQAITSLKVRINEYQARLNNVPAREQELAELTRGYNQSKAIFDDLLKKKNDSEMATNMEQMRQGEQFKMLDPPSLPVKPDFPDRLKFCALGLGFGLALGIAVVVGLEVMNDRLQSEKEIKALLPIAVISEIPEIPIPAEERSKKMINTLQMATGALVVVAILAGSAFSYLHK